MAIDNSKHTYRARHSGAEAPLFLSSPRTGDFYAPLDHQETQSLGGYGDFVVDIPGVNRLLRKPKTRVGLDGEVHTGPRKHQQPDRTPPRPLLTDSQYNILLMFRSRAFNLQRVIDDIELNSPYGRKYVFEVFAGLQGVGVIEPIKPQVVRGHGRFIVYSNRIPRLLEDALPKIDASSNPRVKRAQNKYSPAHVLPLENANSDLLSRLHTNDCDLQSVITNLSPESGSDAQKTANILKELRLLGVIKPVKKFPPSIST